MVRSRSISINTASGWALTVVLLLTLGSGTDSGVLVIGDSNSSVGQVVAGLTTSGTGTANAVVGGHPTSASGLFVNNSTDFTFSGRLGGDGTGENNLALFKSGSGKLVLTGANSYAWNTAINGGVLSISASANLGNGSIQAMN